MQNFQFNDLQLQNAKFQISITEDWIVTCFKYEQFETKIIRYLIKQSYYYFFPASNFKISEYPIKATDDDGIVTFWRFKQHTKALLPIWVTDLANEQFPIRFTDEIIEILFNELHQLNEASSIEMTELEMIISLKRWTFIKWIIEKFL